MLMLWLVHKEKKFHLWVKESEQRITQLEEALRIINKAQPKEKRKKTGKYMKKKRDRKEEIRGLTSALKLRNWLLMEEISIL